MPIGEERSQGTEERQGGQRAQQAAAAIGRDETVDEAAKGSRVHEDLWPCHGIAGRGAWVIDGPRRSGALYY
jgi:hypothetical protein